MSFSRFRPLTSALAMTLLLTYASRSEAQLFGGRCNSCTASAQPMAMMPMQPTAAYDPCNACAPPQQVVCAQPQQVVYRTVPVTEYQQVAQTVRKPIVETAYEDRQHTEYRTVYETRTSQVPVVSYQNVTECQQMTRDMGRWVTCRQPVQKFSPCAYDNSPGLLGMMNRTSYQLRSAFTPNYTTHRQYVPNVVAYNVPVTRQVAHQTMQTVNYQVARLEPYTVTKQVAVQRVRYQDEQVVAMRPVTTYRTVPIGTQTAYGFVPFQEGQGSVTASAPSPDPISTRSAEATPTPVPKRTATNDSKNETKDSGSKSNNSGGGFSPFPPGTSIEPSRKSELEAPVERTVQLTHSPASSANPTVPSMIRSNGWRARTSVSENSPSSVSPDASGTSLQVVQTTR